MAEIIQFPENKNTTKRKNKGFQLKISVNGSNPSIWRTVTVDDNITLAELHKIIQIIFQWEDCHLHEFRFKGKRYSDEESDFFNDALFTLKDLNLIKKSKISYVYDFGDNWKLEILVEKSITSSEKIDFPVCIEVEGPSPMEDCGGIYSFNKMYNKILENNVTSYDYEDETIQWLEEYLQDFDPDVLKNDFNESLKKPLFNDDEDLDSNDYQWSDDSDSFEDEEDDEYNEIIPDEIDSYLLAHDIASKIYEANPWSFLNKKEIIGFKNPETGITCYFVFIYNYESMPTIQILLGQNSLLKYFQLQNGQEFSNQELEFIESYFAIFHNRKELKYLATHKEELDFLNPLDVDSPAVFMRYKRGFVPFFPNEEEISDIVLLLLAFFELLDEIKNSKNKLFKDINKIPVYYFNENKEKWTLRKIKTPMFFEPEEIIVPKVSFDKKKLNKLLSKSKLEISQDTWLIDYFYIPNPIEGKETEAPYYPHMLVVVDENTGDILKHSLFDREYELFEALPLWIVDVICKLKNKPEIVKIKKEYMKEYLDATLQLLKTDVLVVNELPEIDNFISAMSNMKN